MARNQNIEALRIIAAFGIVLFHSGAPGTEFGYSGLIVFAILSAYFARGSINKLSERILLPWAFWSLVYLGLRFITDGNPFHDELTPLQSILYGTHLWYLPFIFVVAVIASRVETSRSYILCGILACILLAATPWYRSIQLNFDPPVAQWLHALPAALIGLSLRNKIGMGFAIAGITIALVWQVPGVSIPYLCGGIGVILAMILPKIRINVEPLAAAMFGVYLVHIAALGVFNRITGPQTTATVICAFVASAVIVVVVRRRFPSTKLLLG